MSDTGKMINELERVLLDQIEKLNDDSTAEDEGEAKMMIEKSKAISDMAGKFTEIQRLKFEVVKHADNNGTLYTGFLGIAEK